MRTFIPSAAILAILSSLLVACDARTLPLRAPRAADPEAVAEVLAGRRDLASAAWWGFDAEDATACLQAAIDSGARVILVPRMSSPWRLGPVWLRGNQEIRFQSGAVVEAIAKDFDPGAEESDRLALFNAVGQRNLRLVGETSPDAPRPVLRMAPEALPALPSRVGEGHHAIGLWGCGNVTVEGLDIVTPASFGVAVNPAFDDYPTFPPCRNVSLRDCRFVGCRRGGVLGGSVKGLRVENCRFEPGGIPDAGPGILLRPATTIATLQEVRILDCRFRGLDEGAVVFDGDRQLRYRPYPSQPELSIEILGGEATDCPGAIRATGLYDPAHIRGALADQPRRPGGWRGVITVEDVSFVRSLPAVRVTNKSVRSASLRLRGLRIDAETAHVDSPPPFEIVLDGDAPVALHGGIEWADCTVRFGENDAPLPPVRARRRGTDAPLRELLGRIETTGPGGAGAQLGPVAEGVTLEILLGGREASHDE